MSRPVGQDREGRSATLSRAIDLTNLPELLNEVCRTPQTERLNLEHGGLICDPRPGREEKKPSFSVSRLASGRWVYNRFGRSDGGNAYTLLLDLGWTPRQTAEYLIRKAGLTDEPSTPWAGKRQARPAPSILDEHREGTRKIHPLSEEENAKVVRLAQPLAGLPADDPVREELRRRGLDGVPAEVLLAGRLARDYGRDPVLARKGALVFNVTGPNGSVLAVKARNLDPLERDDAVVERYVYLAAGHSAPAICSPGYGAASALVVREGELNGIATHLALEASGLSVDVQGVAGAGAWPHIEGMAGADVYPWGDDDQAGRDFTARIVKLARAAGAKSVKVLPALPGGMDPCEYAGVHGRDALGAWLAQALTDAQDPPPEEPTTPQGEPGEGAEFGLRLDLERYSIDELGVYPMRRAKVDDEDDGDAKKKKRTVVLPDRDNPIATRPIYPAALGRDLATGREYVHLKWALPSGEFVGEWHPDHDLRMRDALVALNGAPISLGRLTRLSDFLVDATNYVLAEPLTITSCVGWVARDGGARFVLPGDLDVEYIGPEIKTAGTLGGWAEGLRELVAAGEAGYIALVTVGLSAAAPLVRLLNRRRPVLILVAESSLGKGTVIKYALAIWGDPDAFTVPAGSTHKGTQDKGQATPDFPLFVDELQQALKAGAVKLEDLVYFLGNGKRRVTSNRTQKAVGGENRFGVSLAAAENEIMPALQKGAQFRAIELKGQPVTDRAMVAALNRATCNHGRVAGPLAELANEVAEHGAEALELRAVELEATHEGLRGDDAFVVAFIEAGLEMLSRVTGVDLPHEKVSAWLAGQVCGSRAQVVDGYEDAWTATLETVLGLDWDPPTDRDGQPKWDPDTLKHQGSVVAFRGNTASSASGRLEINPRSRVVVDVLRDRGGETACARVWAERGWIAPQGRNLKWRRRIEGEVMVWRVTEKGRRIVASDWKAG